jgi:hypothetical protein
MQYLVLINIFVSKQSSARAVESRPGPAHFQDLIVRPGPIRPVTDPARPVTNLILAPVLSNSNRSATTIEVY